MVYMLLLLALLAAGGYTVSNVLEYTENVNTDAFKNYRFTTESATPDRIGPGIIQIPGVLGSALAKLGFGSIDCPNGGQYNNNRCEAQPQTTQVDAGIPYMCSTIDEMGRQRIYRAFYLVGTGIGMEQLTLKEMFLLGTPTDFGSFASADVPIPLNYGYMESIIGSINGQPVESIFSPPVFYLFKFGIVCSPDSPYYNPSSCTNSLFIDDLAKGIGFLRFYRGLIRNNITVNLQRILNHNMLNVCMGYSFTSPPLPHAYPTNCIAPENISNFQGRSIPSVSVNVSGPGINGEEPIQNFLNRLNTPNNPIADNCINRYCYYQWKVYANGSLYATKMIKISIYDGYYYVSFYYPCRGQISFGCLDNESYDPNTGMCKKNVYTCPSGYTLDGNVCVANPVINYKAISITWR